MRGIADKTLNKKKKKYTIVSYLLMHFFDDFLGCRCGDSRRLQTIDDVLVGLAGFQRTRRDVSCLGEEAARQKVRLYRIVDALHYSPR